jgi:euchromatic histone-lysine N-methyltransferase
LQADDGMTVLHYAAKAGHNDILKCLLDTGEVDVDIQDDGGWTPIIWASEHKLISTVKFLLDQGAQATLKDKVSLGTNKTFNTCYYLSNFNFIT